MQVNVLVLAYLGDAVYEEYIRKYLIEKGYPNVKELQDKSLSFVSAKSQSMLLSKLVDENILNEEELSILRRARNAKCNHKPKNCDILTYKHATALEAIIGHLAYTNKLERLEFILKKCVEE